MSVLQKGSAMRSLVLELFNCCSENQVQHKSVRGYRSYLAHRTAVVTGASRGIGYAIAKKLVEKIESPTMFCTTRHSAEQLTGLIREEVDLRKAKKVSYKQMEVTNIQSVVTLRNKIYAQQGQVDILVNNAGMYFYPTQEPTEHFVQVQRTLNINYWGLKNVINAFLPMLSDEARIVNINSNYGDLSLIPGTELRQRLADPDLTEKELDEMIMSYQRSSTEFNSTFEIMGWPRCAYTVSKVAVNAYTRILQKQLDQKESNNGIVVNSIYPGSYHSKITKDGDFFMTANEAAVSVVDIALLQHPCYRPRGEFIWHNGQVVDWEAGVHKSGITMKN